MKIRSFLMTFVLILLAAAQSPAADITVAQTGLWSATSTWVGGALPQSTDNIIFTAEYAVTVDGNYTVAGATVNGRGTVLIDTGRKLTITGASNWGTASPRLGKLTFRAGSELSIGGTFQIGAIVMTTDGTTASSPAKLSGSGNIAHTITYRSDVRLQHFIFANTSTAYFSLGSNSASILTAGEAGVTLENCILLAGGKLNLCASSAAAARSELINCDIRDRNVDLSGATGTTVKRMIGNTFSWSGTGRGLVNVVGGNPTVPVSGNVFDNYYFDATAQTIVEADENLIVQTKGTSGDQFFSMGGGDTSPPGRINRNYVFTSLDNSHGFGGGGYGTTEFNNCTENVIELDPATTGGPNIFLFGTAAKRIERNLIMGKIADIAGMSGVISPANGVIVRRNTVAGTAGATTGDPAFLLTELGTGENYNGTEVVASNLFAPSTEVAATNGAFVGGSGASDDVFDTVGHNARYNITGDSYDVGSITNDLTANDVALTTSPGFYAPERNMALWGGDVHGVAVPSVNATVALFLRRNGYDAAVQKQTGTTFIGTVGDLLNWVREGFAPTNTALDGTGYEGEDIGAMDVVEGGDPDPDPDPVPAKYISVTLYTNETPLPNLTGLTAIWWDAVPPAGAPVFTTSQGVTNTNGTITLNLTEYTALNATQNGFLFVYEHNATDFRKSRLFGSQLSVYEQ